MSGLRQLAAGLCWAALHGVGGVYAELPGSHFFRGSSSTGTVLGAPDASRVPVWAGVPMGTDVLVRLEWTEALPCTGEWSVVALAPVSNEWREVDYILPVAPPAGVLWSNSFEEAGWTQAWQVLPEKDWGWANLSRTTAPGEPFETFLRAVYPSNSCSPASSADYGTPEGGGQFLAPAGLSPADALHLRYYVRFHTNFNFVKGGKLPGLVGGTSHFSGGAIPDGTNGFSVRYMWRTDGDGEIYAYLPTSDVYGTEIGRGLWRFQPGVWHCLEQRVVLNTPGVADGRIVVWVDGRMLMDERSVLFRTADSLVLRGIFFSTFFGGGDPSWSSPFDTYADFAGFALSSSYIGP
ncbi:MAG: hypothetical protein KA248_13935 [Kiritimatiellae bacterium]|nr:hypothetical protein [Kiritimatiellia bacterium]